MSTATCRASGFATTSCERGRGWGYRLGAQQGRRDGGVRRRGPRRSRTAEASGRGGAATGSRRARGRGWSPAAGGLEGFDLTGYPRRFVLTYRSAAVQFSSEGRFRATMDPEHSVFGGRGRRGRGRVRRRADFPGAAHATGQRADAGDRGGHPGGRLRLSQPPVHRDRDHRRGHRGGHRLLHQLEDRRPVRGRRGALRRPPATSA